MPRLLDVLQNTVAFEPVEVTPYTFTTLIIPPLFGYYVMAVLVQLPHTRLYRAALLPIVFWASSRAGMSLNLSRNHPGYVYLNMMLASGMFSIAMRSTAWAFARETYTKLPLECNVENDTAKCRDQNAKDGGSVSAAMRNAFDLLATQRGIGWVGPPSSHISKPSFPVESRLAFSLLSLGQVLLLLFALDVTSCYLRWLGLGTFGSPKGGTLFDPLLTPMQRYTKSSVVTLLSGFCGYFLIDAIYHLHAALFTLLLRQHPSQWPPLFDSPWLSTSLASFWGQRWHQLLREPFVIVGYRPLERYFGPAGGILGAFALSGVLHEIGLWGMGQNFDTLPLVVFFLLQGVGIILERAWKKTTGRRVEGIVGFIWAYTALILTGHIATDSWARSGLYGSEFIPEAYRPSTFLLNWIRPGNM